MASRLRKQIEKPCHYPECVLYTTLLLAKRGLVAEWQKSVHSSCQSSSCFISGKFCQQAH